MKSTRFYLLSAAIIGVSLGAAGRGAFGGPISYGDLVVMQVGATGSGTALTSKGTASFLQEFTTAGGNVQTIALPTVVSGANNPLTIGGTAGSEGGISLSADGSTVVVAGYAVGVGVSTQTNSTIGFVNVSSGNVDTSTTTTLLNGNNTRSAASVDGTQYWVTGPKGVIYGTTDTTSGSTSVNAGNFRNVSIVPASVSPSGANALYASSNKTSPSPGLGVASIAPALPTSAGATASLLNGMTSTTAPETYAFFFANPTTMFVADTNLGIQEWTLSAGTWSEVSTLAGSDVGLTGFQDGSTVYLYYTTGTSTAAGWVPDNSLMADTFTFSSGTTGTGTFGTATTLATATGDSGFSGVVLVPEPTSLALLGLGVAGLLARRRTARA